MELFKILGTIAVNNSEANSSIDDTAKKASGLGNTLESIGGKFQSVGEKIGNVGTKLLPVSAGMGALITQGIKYNSQMETFQMNLSTLLGSSDKAAKLLSDLKEMASTTPFETSDLISATETMIGFGIESNKAQEYLGYLGDISMGNSEKLKGLSLAFSQVQSAGKLTGQDLLQMINQGFNPLLYISKMTGESMAEVKERMSKTGISAEEVAEAFKYATQEGQPFYNAMENGSKTISGRISTLKDNFSMLIGSLTESLLPTFEAVIDKAMAIVDAFNSMDDGQKKIITGIMVFVTALGPALIAIGKMTSGVGSLIKMGGKLVGGISKLLPLLGGISAPVLAIVAAIGVLVAAFVTLWNTNEEFRNNILAIWDEIKATFDGFCQGIVDELNELGFDFENISEVIKAAWDGLCSFLQPVFEVAFKTISTIFKAVTDNILGVMKIFIGIFKGDWSKVGEGVKQIVKAFLNMIVNFFKLNYELINKLTGGKLDEIVDKFKEKIEKIKTTVKNGLDAVKSFFDNLKLKLPDIKLPHFKLEGEFSLKPPSVPSVSIDWYKKAMNDPMIMNSPTAFGINRNGQLMAGGEAGSEVVSGTDTLMNMISDAVAAKNEKLENILLSILGYMPQMANMQLVTDTGALVGALAPKMDVQLGSIQKTMERGL